VPTFGEVAASVFAAKSPAWRSKVHTQQWLSSVERYAAAIHALPIDRVDDTAARSILLPIWLTVPEAAPRVRGRVEETWDFAKAKGWVSGENPFRWKGNLEHLLPRRPKLEQVHFSAMSYRDLPPYIAGLRKETSIPRLAMEFLILTAARSSEVRLATWAEIDLEQRIWTIPANRMKAGISHCVPLSTRAVEILAQLLHRSGLIFPGRIPGHPLSPTTFMKLVPTGVTLHGFRSSFRDWAGEETSHAREIAEAALAHSIGSAVERAYRRGTALEKRRALMEGWASFCGGSKSNVVSITARKG
jgi:integrase